MVGSLSEMVGKYSFPLAKVKIYQLRDFIGLNCLND